MKEIKDVINQAKSEIGTLKDAQEKKEQSADFINRVFRVLKLSCPAWRQNFDSEKTYEATKDLWLETLISEGINSEEEIERALKAARINASPFFPSVGQFVQWTKKEASRPWEGMYKEFTNELMPHTVDEYKEMADKGMKKLKENLNKKGGIR